ncbi:hypothetical protein JCM19236_6167 [Vibrio sp. JCM 19236]|nr:hypothetical protein JCM19236_6167 [Vibrio sp. JCM 19236]
MKKINYYLIYHKSKLNSPTFKWLRETLVAQFEPASSGIVE